MSGRVRRIGISMALAASVAAAFFVGTSFTVPDFPARANQPADVMVVGKKGHGSGVHIGHGLYLTAGHVVGQDEPPFKIKTADGSLRDAEIVWISKDRDVALIKASGADVNAVRMTCAPAKIDDSITLKGNPTVMEFVTAYGKVAGKARSMGPWRSVQIVDASVLPGQSGGPVYNARGELVGITVGVATYGMGYMANPTGYGMIVPADVLCELLGRS